MSGLSVSAIRKIERGERDGGRIVTMHALAQSLDVPTSELFEPPSGAPAPVIEERNELDLMRIRRVLTPGRFASPAAAGGLEPRTFEELTQFFRTVAQAHKSNDFASAATAMPRLIEDVEMLRASRDEDEARRAADDLVMKAYHLCGRLLTQLRQYDLAYFAIRRALEMADDPLDTADATSAMAWLFLRQGRFDEVEAIAIPAADAIEPRMSAATTRELTAWSSLLLWAASGAVRNNQPDRVTELMRLARAAAANANEVSEYEDWMYFQPEDWMLFHPTLTREKVERQEVQNKIIVGNYRAALELDEQTPLTGQPNSTSRNRYLLDVASAHLGMRNYTEAFDILRHIRRDVPQWIQHQRLARDLMAAVLERRARPVTSDMRELADFLRLP